MEDPRSVVAGYIASLDGDTRQVAFSEWGLTVDAGGAALHVGVALRDGLFRAQAAVAAPGALDPHDVLWWNRTVPLVSFSHTQAAETWIGVDLPLAAVTPAELDRVLGLLVLAATQARQHAAASDPGRSGSPAGPA